MPKDHMARGKIQTEAIYKRPNCRNAKTAKQVHATPPLGPLSEMLGAHTTPSALPSPVAPVACSKDACLSSCHRILSPAASTVSLPPPYTCRPSLATIFCRANSVRLQRLLRPLSGGRTACGERECGAGAVVRASSGAVGVRSGGTILSEVSRHPQ